MTSTENRTLNIWTKKDHEQIIEFLDLDLLSLGEALDRDPISVARHISSDLCAKDCDAISLGIDFYPGSEAESELIGLLVCGAPIGIAISWVCAKEDRLPEEMMLGLLSSSDARPAVQFANEHGIWVSSIEHINDVFPLMGFPVEMVTEAVSYALENFLPPLPGEILNILDGRDIEKYAFKGISPFSSCTGARSRKSKRTTSTKGSFKRRSYKSFRRSKQYARAW